MPATTWKLRSPAGTPLSGPSKQANGLYVHFSPPKVLQVNSSLARRLLLEGDVARLEKAVLEGWGRQLMGANSPDPRIRRFLKQVPGLVSRIDEVHEAAAKGDVGALAKIFKTSSGPSKNVFLSKNLAGIGLLHRAVYHGHPEVVQFLALNFPRMVNAKDKEGRTPLHYCGASGESEKIWPMLVKAGADPKVADSRGKIPFHYMQRPNEISLPPDYTLSNDLAAGLRESDLQIKPANIRIWIHQRDLEKLERVIWEGHGDKLLVETSNNAKVKRFLEGVPHVLNAIKDLHLAVINDDVEDFLAKGSHPVPVEILASRDANGLNSLHKAAGLGRFNIAKAIVERNPKLVHSVDKKGRTPLHYAATALRDGDDSIYNLLLSNDADETALDLDGKTPVHYKANPKEILKLLKVVPEAPRTFPSHWDWTMLRSSRATPTLRQEPKTNHEEVAEKMDSRESIPELFNSSFRSQIEGGAKSAEEEKGEEEKVDPEENAEAVEYFDLWENENYELDNESGDQGSEVEKNDGGSEETDEKEEIGEDEKESEKPTEAVNDSNGSGENDQKVEEEQEKKARNTSQIEGMVEKTEREVGEERQRLLDEGLLKIEDESEDVLDGTEEDIVDERDQIERMIDEEDLEGLACLVLNGEGEKLLGKDSKNAEVRTFLENLPSYLEKIASVHKAIRNGSLKELQATLDRRRFAAAKESSDKLGATPLHVAVLLRKPQIVKYLGGRFPETLNLKDNFGRTPLHYAASMPDDGHSFSSLLNLGADRKVKDDDGLTPVDYRENPKAPSHGTLLEEYDAAAHLARDMLTGHENVLFGSEDGKYLADELGSPLIRGLTEIANKRPRNPIACLADFLYEFLNKNKGCSSPPERNPRSEQALEPEVRFEEGKPLGESRESEIERETGWENGPGAGFAIADRDEFGQSVLHFAAGRAHGRTGIFQLIEESDVNLGHRDELYRTARDVAMEANLVRNVEEIDKYVISLAARGETEKLKELFLEGYDHITDLKTDGEADDVTAIANRKNQDETVAFLKAIPALEARRERLHAAIRTGNSKSVRDAVEGSRNMRMAVIGKNARGRSSLHIAVLCQQKEIVQFLASEFPESLKIGDNLERTPMHYAMGVEEIETLSGILIKSGAERVTKDLKGRQPTYYFMNKSDILKLQKEEQEENFY